jgi:hypothetical protein
LEGFDVNVVVSRLTGQGPDMRVREWAIDTETLQPRNRHRIASLVDALPGGLPEGTPGTWAVSVDGEVKGHWATPPSEVRTLTAALQDIGAEATLDL